VYISDATLKTVANGGHVQNTCTQSGGQGGTMPADLIFTSDSAGNNLLPWEIDYYDPVGGVLWAWVQIPTLSHTANVTFYVFYGSSSVTTQQNTGSYSPANVWDANYQGVWHLGSGSSLSTSDSTSNANNGSCTTPSATSGDIAGGASVSASANAVVVTSNAGLQQAAALTVSAWVNPSGTGTLLAAVSEDDNGSNKNWALGTGSTASNWRFQAIDSAGTTHSRQSTSNYTTGAWHYLVGIFDGANIWLYVDNLAGVSSACASIKTTAANFCIGQKANGANVWAGSLDEVRYSKVARSSSQILAEYNNQKSGSTFLAIGAEQGGGGGSTPAPMLMLLGCGS
jgi:biopolymer transport protein ExbB